MDDETLIRTIENGLMVAGHEMGPVGDHWPALHAIAAGVKREYEEYRREQAVIGEMEFHFANALRDLEDTLVDCNPEQKKILGKFIKESWDDYYAALEPVAPTMMPKADDLMDADDKRIYNMRAAIGIIKNLESRGGVL